MHAVLTSAFAELKQHADCSVLTNIWSDVGMLLQHILQQTTPSQSTPMCCLNMGKSTALQESTMGFSRFNPGLHKLSFYENFPRANYIGTYYINALMSVSKTS